MLRLAWLTDTDVLVPVIDQPLVDLIRDAQDIMLLTQIGHQLQLCLREHLWEPRSRVCSWDCPQGQSLLGVQDIPGLRASLDCVFAILVSIAPSSVTLILWDWPCLDPTA